LRIRRALRRNHRRQESLGLTWLISPTTRRGPLAPMPCLARVQEQVLAEPLHYRRLNMPFHKRRSQSMGEPLPEWHRWTCHT
jgi:hypothetical protein